MPGSYIVNVNIGGTIQIEVSASSEDDAELLAMGKASQFITLNNTNVFKLDVIEAEVIKKIINMKTIKQKI
tara:strand:+ start:334 stop:546 length:213 start_codon:yes stop_codon:yes gene_type:complete